jgi:hypothetical protein
MVEGITFFSGILVIAGLGYLLYTLKYLSKGQIRTPSIWDKKPISFKNKPELALLIAIVQIILSLFFLVLGIAIFVYN